jgi:hypothetical protein
MILPYQPRLHHAIFTALFSILFAYLWGWNGANAFLFACILFLAITTVIMLSLIEGSHYYSVTGYIEALVKMDSDLRNALAFHVPSLRLVAKRGQIQTMFDDTRVPVKYLHLFLQGTTKTQSGINTTPPKRDWNTAERPAWAWQEIYNWLADRNYVREYATGPDSYEYIGTAYQNLSVYYLSHSIPNLGSGMVQYANETEQVQDV